MIIIICDINEDTMKIFKSALHEMKMIYYVTNDKLDYNVNVICRLQMEHIDFMIHQDMEYFRKYMEVMGEVYKILNGMEEDCVG